MGENRVETIDTMEDSPSKNVKFLSEYLVKVFVRKHE